MRRYLIVIERADGNFSAYSPDLPGCVATGTDAEECRRNMEDAISLHIQGMRQDGLPVPEAQTRAECVTVRV